MSQLLYFVDGSHRLTLEQARQLGLGYAFASGQYVCAEYTAGGPGGDTGCLLGTDSERLGYYRERQTWLRMPAIAGGKVHVGYWNDARPTPTELAVPEQLRGTPIKLKDGQDWIVPIARECSEGGHWSRVLPGVLALDDQNQWTSGGIDPKYSRLWEIAESFWRCLFRSQVGQDHTMRFDFPGANDAAVEVLAANYRLGRAEVALLGLFDDQLELAAKVLHKLIDFETFLAWQKKSLAPPILAGSTTSVGAEASPATTDPPSPTFGRSRRSPKPRK